MKIIHLNLKRECVLVELPREITHFEYGCGSDGIYLQWHDGQIDEFEGCIGEHGQIKLSDNPRDSFKRLGKITDFKEKDFDRIVDGAISGHYLNYSYDNAAYKWLRTAKESFISAIEAEGWYTENPCGKKPATSDYDNYDHSYGDNVLSYEGSQEYYRALKDWQKAQEKVINLINCYLFVKA